MKMYKYILFSVMTLIMVSCKDFLEVTPRTESPEEVMYKTERGFKDVLTGVYIQMKNNDLYGKELTFGTLEHLLSSWKTETGSAEEYLNKHDYSHADVIKRLDEIYARLYTGITNLNGLLANIDQKRTVFANEATYRLVKGEALGLRAYLHLDILRLYGPVPHKKDAAPLLPYVTTVSKKAHAKSTFDGYMEQLLADLKSSEELLYDIDPVTQYSLKELRNPGRTAVFNPADDFFTHRMLRLNVYAVKALIARASLWKGDMAMAYRAAKEVVEAMDADGQPKFKLGTSEDITLSDFSFINEHVFGLFDHTLEKKYADNFASGNLYKGNDQTLVKTELYGNTGKDIRELRLWEVVVLSNKSRVNIIKKYNVKEYGGKENGGGVEDAVELKQIPMIRIAELYLILAESAQPAEAQQYWDKLLKSRELPSRPLTGTRQEEVMKEFRREFIGEGQAFYMYKRADAAAGKIVFKARNSAVEYRLPMPLNEL